MTHRFKLCCAAVAALALAAPGSARAFGVYPFLAEPAVIPVSAERVEVLDFDGDGWPDLAGITRTGAAFAIAGDGEPQTLAHPGLSGRGFGTAAGDLDGDGHDDLVAVFEGSGSLAVFRGAGDGRLTAPDVHALRGPRGELDERTAAVATGDLDGDGDLDVVAAFGPAHDVRDPVDTSASGRAIVLENDGHGRLTATGPELPVNAPLDVVLVERAGDLDLVVLTRDAPSNVVVFPGAAGAGFGAPTTYDSGPRPTSLATGDLNHDGRTDVAIGHDRDYRGDHATVRVLIGTPTGLQPADTNTPLAGSVAIADADGDGVDDLYVADGAKTFGWQPAPGFVHGRGDLYEFGLPAWIEYAANRGDESDPALADFDGDGKLDVVAIGAYNGDVLIRFGTGPQLVPNGWGSQGPDTMLTTTSHGNIQFENQGGGIARDLEIWSDGDTHGFTFTLGTCAGAVLGYGDSCTMQYSFTPTELGRRDAEVAVSASNSDIVWPQEVSGEGIPFVAPPPTTSTTTTYPRLDHVRQAPPPLPRRITPPKRTRPAVPTVARVTRAKLLRNGVRFTQALQAGTTRWTLESKGKVLGRAVRVLTAPDTVKLTLKLTASGRRALKRARPARLTLRTHDVSSGLERATNVRIR